MSLVRAVADQVRIEMFRRGTTQRQIAEILGLSQTQVSRRLQGLVELRLSELERIAAAMGVPVAVLLPATGGES